MGRSPGPTVAATCRPSPESLTDDEAGGLTGASGLLTRASVRALLDRHGLEPSRALGQNFLCEPSQIERIVRLSGVGPGDAVVEIGPGLGSLSLGLCRAGVDLVAVERDRYLLPALAEVLADHPHTVIEGDALELDWDAVLGDRSWTMVANLPYNVGTPLLLGLLAEQPKITRFLVMVQAEVGERLAARPGERAAGIPSVVAAVHGDAEVVARVPAQVFLPPPRVESVLVAIDRHPAPVVESPPHDVIELARAGFAQRRKMLRKSLSGLLDVDGITAAGVDPTLRAEAVTLAGWDALAGEYGRRRGD